MGDQPPNLTRPVAKGAKGAVPPLNPSAPRSNKKYYISDCSVAMPPNRSIE